MTCLIDFGVLHINQTFSTFFSFPFLPNAEGKKTVLTYHLCANVLPDEPGVQTSMDVIECLFLTLLLVDGAFGQSSRSGSPELSAISTKKSTCFPPISHADLALKLL